MFVATLSSISSLLAQLPIPIDFSYFDPGACLEPGSWSLEITDRPTMGHAFWWFSSGAKSFGFIGSKPIVSVCIT